MKDLPSLEERIGHRFRERRLLIQALTHRSASSQHMERLEFLGDAVLSLAIAEYLYFHYPEMDEGALSRARAHLVSKETLMRVAESLGVHHWLRVGGGGRDASGRLLSPAMAADAVEAILGAIFLDAGWTAARNVVRRLWDARLHQPLSQRDAKTSLQEWTQSLGMGLPDYRVKDRGPTSRPRFEAQCLVQGRVVGHGFGGKKKEAEMEAAKQALLTLADANG